MCKKWERFTLIELLVVVAIIGVLVSLLLPSLQKARMQAKSAKCKSNLRQIGLGTLMSVDDNDGQFFYQWGSYGQAWWVLNSTLMDGYLQRNGKLAECPSAPNSKWGNPNRDYYTNYGSNDSIMPGVPMDWLAAKIVHIPRPSEVVMFIDSPYVSEDYGAWFRIEPPDGPNRRPAWQNEATAYDPIIQLNAVYESAKWLGTGWEALNTQASGGE